MGINYSQEVIDFLKIPNNRSLLSKAVSNRIKFANTIKKYADIFKAFDAISTPFEMTNHEKMTMIAHDILEPPKCPACDKYITSSQNTGSYGIYCDAVCYAVGMSMKNNQRKNVIINGIVYNSVAHACEELGDTYFTIKQKLYSDDTTYQYHPDHNEQMKTELKDLKDKSPFLLDYEYLIEKKNAYIPMKVICKEIGVIHNDLMLAYCYHNIDTKHEQIPRESKILLNDKDWLDEQIKNRLTKDIAMELNCSDSSIHHKCTEFNIDIPNRHTSFNEEEISKFIVDLGFYIEQRTRRIIHPLEIDIYIPSMKIGIEHNGLFWHKEKQNKHIEKYTKCRETGVRLIQIFEDDWNEHKDIVKNKLMQILGVSSLGKVFARKCELIIPDGFDMRMFYNKNHIYGHKNCGYHFALTHDNKIVAGMSFTYKLGELHLERFATSCNVTGGFSKLLSYAISELKDKISFSDVVTFADLCWSDENDNVYTKNGFVLDHISRPNYFWTKKGIRYSRLKFQKHKLVNMESYSDEKSERQIMEEEKYYKVYDSGHAKLVMKIK